MDSAFWILSFDPPTDGEVVYFEHPTCSLYLEKPDEVARNLPGIVAVRDSKNPHGPVLIVNRDEWASFITCLRVGQPARQK